LSERACVDRLQLGFLNAAYYDSDASTRTVQTRLQMLYVPLFNGCLESRVGDIPNLKSDSAVAHHRIW
jgi:hypothetical protein